MIYFHNLVTIYGLLISVIPRPLNYWAHTVTGCGYVADLHSHCRFLWKLQMAQTHHCHMNILFHSSLASSGAWCCLSTKCIIVGRNHLEFFKEKGPEIAGTSLHVLSTLCRKITGVILDDLPHLHEARGHLKGEDYCSGPSTSLTHWIIDAAIGAEGLPKGSTNA